MHTHALRTCPISYLSVMSDRLLYVRPSRRARHPNGMTASTCPEENKRTHTHTAINLNTTKVIHSRGACLHKLASPWQVPHRNGKHAIECCFNMTEEIKNILETLTGNIGHYSSNVQNYFCVKHSCETIRSFINRPIGQNSFCLCFMNKAHWL